MKILHVIPNAFEYFEDIYSEAFEIVEAESENGIEVDAVTIGYGGVTKKEKFEVSQISPSRKFIGHDSFGNNIKAWEDYDVINIHCPFFGEIANIIKWSKSHPDKSLIVTYHHDFIANDLFGLIIKFYNFYYLPKLFDVAKVVAFFDHSHYKSLTGIKMLKNFDKSAILGLPPEGDDIHNFSIADDLIIVYNNLMFK